MMWRTSGRSGGVTALASARSLKNLPPHGGGSSNKNGQEKENGCFINELIMKQSCPWQHNVLMPDGPIGERANSFNEAHGVL